MSRYDRNRNKKSNNTIFILAILISLLIGISGTYYVLENSKKLKQEVVADLDNAPAKENSNAQGVSEAEQVPVGSESGLLSVTPETLPNNIDQATAQQADLPDLLSSDEFVRQAITNLAPGLSPWLNTDQLIRKYVLIVNDFAQSLRIAKHISFLRFDEPFSVEQGADGAIISAKSFQRYDKLALTIQSIDAKSAVALYQKLRPLMLQVFVEFSYPPDISLESTIKKAAGEILAAPVLEGQIPLVRPSVHYKFADAKLEGLSPVQKQMLRMGPANMRIIQAKCREFLVALAKSGL
jgi:Protein of unknown function (DUF3014)